MNVSGGRGKSMQHKKEVIEERRRDKKIQPEVIQKVEREERGHSNSKEVVEERRRDRKINKIEEEEVQKRVEEKWKVTKREDHKNAGRCFSVDTFLSPEECKYEDSLSLPSPFSLSLPCSHPLYCTLLSIHISPLTSHICSPPPLSPHPFSLPFSFLSSLYFSSSPPSSLSSIFAGI